MHDEFYDLSEPLQKAVEMMIGRSKEADRQCSTILDGGEYEVYAYPHPSGVAAWGVNSKGLGWANYKRGIRASIADASGAQCDRRLAELRDALSEAWIAMNYMGDVLNGCDMTDERDEAVCNPSWERIRELAPFLETIDLDAKYRERHQESLGNCVDCEADIQWCDPYQLLALGEKRCILCSNAKALARRQDEEPQGDTEQPNGRAPA